MQFRFIAIWFVTNWSQWNQFKIVTLFCFVFRIVIFWQTFSIDIIYKNLFSFSTQCLPTSDVMVMTWPCNQRIECFFLFFFLSFHFVVVIAYHVHFLHKNLQLKNMYFFFVSVLLLMLFFASRLGNTNGSF